MTTTTPLPEREQQARALIERLRRTKTQHRVTYGFGGMIAFPDESETREVPVNPDGPAAADLIEALAFADAPRPTSAPVAIGGIVVVPTKLLRSIFADYMTSEKHHPNHVLIPSDAFEALREVFDNAPEPSPALPNAKVEACSNCGEPIDFTGMERCETLICNCGRSHPHPEDRGDGYEGTRTPTSAPVVGEVDAETEAEIANGEKARIVAWLRRQSDLGANRGIAAEKGSTKRAAFGGGSLALKRAADAIEADEHVSNDNAILAREQAASPPPVEGAASSAETERG